MTQDELAAAIRPKGSVDQTRISKWERGKQEPSLEEIKRFEEAAGRPLGFVVLRAGFVQAAPVEQSIAADKALSSIQRDHLLNAYAVALQMSEKER